MNEESPILEFDPSRKVYVEPADVIAPGDVPEHCVLSFSQEAIASAVAGRKGRVAAVHKSSLGEHTLYELDWNGRRLGLMHAGLGGPLAAALLEELIARGCRKFMACGSCGALDKALVCGHVVVPNSAVRDEGTSYHYLPPSREVGADPAIVAMIEGVLRQHAVPFVTGKTWTTDAFYRETFTRVERRRSEGCITVEMEAASLLAAAAFRNVPLGMILAAGDDLSGEAWDARQYSSMHDVHDRILLLAAECCLRL